MVYWLKDCVRCEWMNDCNYVNCASCDVECYALQCWNVRTSMLKCWDFNVETVELQRVGWYVYTKQWHIRIRSHFLGGTQYPVSIIQTFISDLGSPMWWSCILHPTLHPHQMDVVTNYRPDTRETARFCIIFSLDLGHNQDSYKSL